MEVQRFIRQKSIFATKRTPHHCMSELSGERRKLFINRSDGEGVIGIIAKGKRKRGYVFNAWSSIEKVYYPTTENEEEAEKKMILKYQKLARLATHTNDWLRRIAGADLTKSLYENHITTGTGIDGKCIRLSTIEEVLRLHGDGMLQGSLQKRKRSIQAIGLTFAVMTGHFGVNRKRMVI